jgi:integrase
MSDEISYDELLRGIARAEEDFRAYCVWAELPEEYDRFYKQPVGWTAPLLALLWLTGGRISEVLAIRGRDIQVKQLPSGKNYAAIELTNLKQRGNQKWVKKKILIAIDKYPEAWKVVEDYFDQLQNPDGLFFHKTRVAAWYKCQRYFNIGTHKTGRHSWVMNHAREGHQLLDIKQMGGWSTLDAMQKYVHEFGERELGERVV